MRAGVRCPYRNCGKKIANELDGVLRLVCPRCKRSVVIDSSSLVDNLVGAS